MATVSIPLRSRWRRRLGFTGLALLLIWFLLSWLVAYLLTHRSQAGAPETAPRIGGIQAETVRLHTSDGEEIGAWYLPGTKTEPVVLLLHGWHGNRGSSRSRAGLFTRLGCGVLAISLRAHGDSTGTVNDFGRSNRLDILAAVEWLEQRHPGRPLLLNGVSQGAAAAIFTGGELGQRVQGYLLEAPYRDLSTAVRNRTRKHLPPVLDQTAYLGLMLAGPLVLGDIGDIAPSAYIGQIPATIPVWILAGTADEEATPEEATDLWHSRAGRGRVIFFPGARHRSLYRQDQPRFEQTVRAWLAEIRGTK